MSELRELYQTLILDHNRSPRNWGSVEQATHRGLGHNPLCGDRLSVTLNIEDDVIRDVRFEGSGCAISKASASLMTSAIKGKSTEETRALFGAFHRLATGEPADANDQASLGKLAVFAGVREYPARVKCATLSWHTALGALESSSDAVSTE